MIRFKQFINEEYKYRSVPSPTQHITALFTFKDEDNKNYDVAFAEVNDSKSFEVTFTTDGSMDKTNTAKNPTAVFRTVGNVIDYFISAYKPKAITFYSEKLHPSRVRLYKSLANRLARKYNSKVEYEDLGWKLGYIIKVGKT